MAHFNLFNAEQDLARYGMSPATLAFRLLDDRYDDRYKAFLNSWIGFTPPSYEGAPKMVALRNYNNALSAALKSGSLDPDRAEIAKAITKKLSPYLREEHLKYMQIEVTQWPLPLKTTLEIHAAEKVEPFEGLDDMKQRVAGDNRLLFVAKDPFVRDGILIDVQVALVDRISSDIHKVKTGIDGKGVARPSIAIYYAISNADKVSGIAETFLRSTATYISRNVPGIKFNSTLSPIPGLVPWITGGKGLDSSVLEHAFMLAGTRPLMSVQEFCDTVGGIEKHGFQQAKPIFFPVLSRVTALYIISGQADASGRYRYTNSVANFHLPNGAHLGRVIVGADKSAKGRRQSGTMMANYFYDLPSIDQMAALNRAGKPQLSGGISAALQPSTRHIADPQHDHQYGQAIVYNL